MLIISLSKRLSKIAFETRNFCNFLARIRRCETKGLYWLFPSLCVTEHTHRKRFSDNSLIIYWNITDYFPSNITNISVNLEKKFNFILNYIHYLELTVIKLWFINIDFDINYRQYTDLIWIIHRWFIRSMYVKLELLHYFFSKIIVENRTIERVDGHANWLMIHVQ